MKITLSAVLGAFAGVILFAGQAAAIQTEFIETGTVTGTDNSGLFGAPGASLTGDSFVANYFINTALGEFSSSPESQDVSGGSSLNLSSPVYAKLTINGGTIVFNGSQADGYSFAEVEDGVYGQVLQAYVSND